MPLRTIRELIHPRRLRSGLGALAGAIIGAAVALPAYADETCMSPYMAKIVGQEDFVYVWTLGTTGLGDVYKRQDSPVTSMRPGRA